MSPSNPMNPRSPSLMGRTVSACTMSTLAGFLSAVVSSGMMVGCGGGAGATTGSNEPAVSPTLQEPQQTQQQRTVAAEAVASGDPVSPGPYWSYGAAQPIADFDTLTSTLVGGWTFFNGAEFPGAYGSLGETTGQAGKAAKLVYDFSCEGNYWTALAGRQCGKYVSMTLPKLPGAIDFSNTTVPTISFDVRNPQATATPAVRVVDSTGQTLQFKRISARPIENVTGSNWQRIVVPLTNSQVFWGGANDGVVHLPLKQVSVLAGDVALPVPPGELEIDNVSYLKTADTTFELKTNPPLSSYTFPSTYVGRIGVVWRPRYGYAALEKAIAAGINVVRMDLNWEAVEINGKWDFTYYTNIAAELAKRNVKILWILDYGHKDHGGTVPLSPVDQDAYAEFARRSAIAFKGTNLFGFEVWNEPNWEPFWPSPDPVAYGNLLGRTVDAIRSVDSTVKISTGGVADTDFDYLMNLLKTGKASKVSALGLHPYRTSGPETYSAQLATFKQMMQSVGLNAEIWDTEWGYSAFRDIGSVAEYGDGHDPRALRRQGILTIRKVLTQVALNSPLSILYELVNDGSDPLNREHNFGLLNADTSDKPAMQGLKSLYAAQNGRVLKGFLPDVPPGLHVLRWDGTTSKAFAIWSDAPAGSKVQVTLPASTTSVKFWDGSAVPTVNGNKFYLQESDGPVFVTIKK